MTRGRPSLLKNIRDGLLVARASVETLLMEESWCFTHGQCDDSYPQPALCFEGRFALPELRCLQILKDGQVKGILVPCRIRHLTGLRNACVFAVLHFTLYSTSLYCSYR